MATTPILDWRPRHDPRSRDYAVREVTRGKNIARRPKHWDGGPVLDQGAEGACVGFAFAGDALGKPIPADLTRLKDHVPPTPDHFARFLYGMAKYLDPWEGENYSGTSVLAGAKAAQNANVLRKYHWAFSVQEVIDAVLTVGPVVIGINWYAGMYSAPGGILRRSGPLVGGHALRVVGYHPSSENLAGQETVTLRNSWGADWGVNGEAEMTVTDLAGLLAENGEACVPTSRSYGR